jgi:cell division protein FtsB
MPDFRAPRVRMPKVSLPGRGGGSTKKPTASKAKTKEQPKDGNGAKPAAAKDTATKETATKDAAKPAETKAATPTKSAATKAAAGSSPEPNLQERMEGLQGWMAEIERKQGRMTYFGLAGVLIAILAAGAALYFGLTAKSDSATKGDFDALSKRIDGLEAATAKSSKDAQTAINTSVSQLQQTLASLQKQQAQNAANIATLQTQASSGAFGKGAAAGAGAGATLTPGTTTTTPNGK